MSCDSIRVTLRSQHDKSRLSSTFQEFPSNFTLAPNDNLLQQEIFLKFIFIAENMLKWASKNQNIFFQASSLFKGHFSRICFFKRFFKFLSQKHYSKSYSTYTSAPFYGFATYFDKNLFLITTFQTTISFSLYRARSTESRRFSNFTFHLFYVFEVFFKNTSFYIFLRVLFFKRILPLTVASLHIFTIPRVLAKTFREISDKFRKQV